MQERGWVVKIPIGGHQGGEWITVSYFGQDDHVLPCVYETKEQAIQSAKNYPEHRIEEVK